MVNPYVSIKSLTFSDGTVTTFDANDIIVLVGPNNAGKSAALRNIKETATRRDISRRVVTDLELQTTGTESDLVAWLEDGNHARSH